MVSFNGSVPVSFGEFEPLLRSSGTPFFPEYTDHSDKHVREVLDRKLFGSR